jgi:hypothetical protein
MRVARCLAGVPAAEAFVVQLDQGARNAELRGEVARLSGLAAALDEYEHAPHGENTVRRRRGRRGRFRKLLAMRDARSGMKDSSA